MFRLAKLITLAVAIFLTASSFWLNLDSVFWNIVILPICLTLLGVLMASFEYIEAKLESSPCQVYCYWQHKHRCTPDATNHQDAA